MIAKLASGHRANKADEIRDERDLGTTASNSTKTRTAQLLSRLLLLSNVGHAG